MKQIFIITEFSFAGPVATLNTNQVLQVCKTLEEAEGVVRSPINKGRALVVLPAFEIPNSRTIHYLTINHKPMTKEQIAHVVHEITRVYNNTLQPWLQASDLQKDAARKIVQYHIDNPGATPKDVHNAWLTEKANTGWGFGPLEDELRKQTPRFVEYAQLPKEEQTKNDVVKVLVDCLKIFLQATPAWDTDEATTAPSIAPVPPRPNQYPSAPQASDTPVVHPPLTSHSGEPKQIGEDAIVVGNNEPTSPLPPPAGQ